MRHKNNIFKNICIIIIILSTIALLTSIIILIQKNTYSVPLENFCSVVSGSANSCHEVQNSNYGKTLGIDNPIYGIVGFLSLIILSIILITGDNKNKIFKLTRNLTIIGLIIAGIIAMWFLYVQKFILHKYCIYCIVVDIISIILFIIGVYIIYILNKRK